MKQGQFHLDTSILVQYLRGRSEALRVRLQVTPVSNIRVSQIVRAELLHGALKSARPEHHRKVVESLLAHFQVLPWDGSAAEHYADIKSDLEKRGKLIGPNDLMIAAAARAAGVVLISSDSDFAKVSGLSVKDWTLSAQGESF